MVTQHPRGFAQVQALEAVVGDAMGDQMLHALGLYRALQQVHRIARAEPGAEVARVVEVVGFGEFEGANTQGNRRQRGFRRIETAQRLAVAFTHAIQVGGHHLHAGGDLAVHRVAFDGLRAAGEHQAFHPGGHSRLEQIGGGEDVVGQQLIERRAGVGDARQVHDHVDAIEQGGQAGFVAEVGMHETVFAEGKIRRNAVGEGEAVAVFRGFEKRLADSAASAG
ncbi:hypothetical protein BHE74_00001488 [Ensete ventricosum]|nr:hypothetical protein BHE74_00001488 [Ensete ventricosum]